jgi:hypothetical protein
MSGRVPIAKMWIYYTPTGGIGRMGPLLDTQVVETVGRTQLAVMLRARQSSTGMVMDGSEKERLAARRLVERKLLTRNWTPEPRWSAANRRHVERKIRTYTLTLRGRTCWLRAKPEVQG